MAAGITGAAKVGKKQSVASGTPPVVVQKAAVRIVGKGPGEKGPNRKVLVSIGPGEELDVTGALTATLAHALWQLRGGVDIGNWVDGEVLLDQLVIPSEAATPKATVSPAQVVIPSKPAAARR